MRLHTQLALATAALLVLALIPLTVWMTHVAESHQAEIAQRLNAGVAMYVTEELALFDAGGVNREALEELAHRVMTVNPSAEVYLLSPRGNIVATLVPNNRLTTRVVGLQPIQRFLRGSAERLIEGDDPTRIGRRVPFSVAPVHVKGRLVGYLYVVFGGKRYQSVLDAVRNSYALRAGLPVAAFILLVTAALGALVFAVLTLPLRQLGLRMQRWASRVASDTTAVARNDSSRNELHTLACQFTAMAQQIEQQMAEIQARDRERREFVATISHDLRTPLAALHGYLETIQLKDDFLSRSERQQHLAVAMRHSERLGQLIAALFELSKLESAAYAPSFVAFSIAELVQDVALRFRLRAQQNQIALSVRVDPAAPAVLGDIALIERIFENLLDNALRHTPAGGRICIGAETHDELMHVSVYDSGTGISRAGALRLQSRGGNGLGLAIVRRIVELHGGSFSIADSTVERTGTFASFSIRLADQDRSRPARESTAINDRATDSLGPL